MFKFTIIVSLMLIATWSQGVCYREKKDATASDRFVQGTTLWAASMSCDSCGTECKSACGTRHFRTCCFNYLKKKRTPEGFQVLSRNNVDARKEHVPESKLPYFIVQNIPESMISDLIADEYEPVIFDDTIGNGAMD